MKPDTPAVLSLFQIHPRRFDGTAMFARALSAELSARGGRSVLCFPSAPPPPVRDFMAVGGASIETESTVFEGTLAGRIKAFRSLLHRHRPAIVHVHFMGLLSPFPWLSRIYGVERFFFTDHGSRPESGSVLSPVWKRLLRRPLYRPIRKVVAVSEYVFQSHLFEGNLPPDRLHLIVNGVDLERVSAAAAAPQSFRLRMGIPAERILITQVSWLIEQKGAADFVEAAKRVVAARPDTHFCLAGDGPCREELTAAVNAAGIAGHFTFAGQVEDPFFDGLFAASDIICQPSRWNEAFGWVLAEAMAFGKPVVGARAGAIPEIVRHGETGFLVDRRNPAELAARLIELVSQPSLRLGMGAAARADAHARFALTRNIREHMRLYGLDLSKSDLPKTDLLPR